MVEKDWYVFDQKIKQFFFQDINEFTVVMKKQVTTTKQTRF